MVRTFELVIKCEDDDYEAFALQNDIESLMRRLYDREEVSVELTEMAPCY